MAKTNVSIDVSELRELMEDIQRATTKTMRLLDDAVDESALLVHRKAVEKVQKGSRSGVKYRRGGKRAQRSAVGEPAKTDTGNLVSAIRPNLKGFMQAEVGSLESVAPYAEYLEDVDKLNRPFMVPTLEENRGEINRKISSAIRGGGLG